jgi:hypothetical protein
VTGAKVWFDVRVLIVVGEFTTSDGWYGASGREGGGCGWGI